MEETSINRIEETIRGLCQFENRIAGSKSEARAAEFLINRLQSCGIQDVKESSFSVLSWKPVNCQVSIIEPLRRKIEAALFPCSPSAECNGNLIAIDQTSNETLNNGSQIGLSPWGNLLYQSVTIAYYQAVKLGLEAVLIAAPDDGDLRKVVIVDSGGSLKIPVISISKEDASFLSDLMGSIKVVLEVRTEVDVDPEAQSKNLEVVIEGNKESEHEICIGAHYDAWFKGAADNAAPVAIVLELAHLLNEHVVNGGSLLRTVRFLFFGAEESGSTSFYYWINGSKAYVAANKDTVIKTAAMLSLDSIGFPPPAPNNVGATGGLLAFAKSIQVGHGIASNVTFFGPPGYGSDHWFFEISGVPTIYGLAFPSKFYHTQKDDPDNLDYDGVHFHAEFMRSALFTLANAPLLPLDVFGSLTEIERILTHYNEMKDCPFDAASVVTKIKRIRGKKKAFEKATKSAIAANNTRLLEKMNRFHVLTARTCNRTIGRTLRSSSSSGVSYLAKLELIADYMEIHAAVNRLKQLPIANLANETIKKLESQEDNPFSWISIHEPLGTLEKEAARISRVVESELANLSDALDGIWQDMGELLSE